MQGGAIHHDRVAPWASAASAVEALFVDECHDDMRRVAIPRAEMHLVVRFGRSTRNGLDVHALGVRETVHRKVVRGGQRIVMARLRLGTHEAVLGVPASAIGGGIIALEDLWGDAAARRLLERLGDARSTLDAGAVLGSAIAERVAAAVRRPGRGELALAAADRLSSASVHAVAVDLGVSERHLRRVFGEALGMTPKTFTRLARFHRALRVARGEPRASWAGIAAATGYYDQAHLIAEFRAIAGVTPRALIGELRAAPPVG